ncbi:MAG: hypothetical protein ACK5Q1_13285 [Limnobacter sp.]
MNLERKILLASMVVAVAGWLTATTLATAVGAFKLRAVSAEKDAAVWKRQASKAYTELLKARAGTDRTTVIIPAGALIDCTISTTIVDGKTVSKCQDGTIYPPRDY